MPRKPSVPTYRLHKNSGQAVVTLNGRDHYLGKHDTPESRAAYERLVAEWLAAGRAPRVDKAPDLTVSEVIDAYWSFAKSYYRDAQDRPTKQIERVRNSLAAARDLYGPTPARSFGPASLKACRQKFVDAGICRRLANQRTDCIRRAWKWAVAEELVPSAAYEALRAVASLRSGRTEAPDHAEVKPVPPAHLEKSLPHLPPFLADVARLQLLTALRPGEALALQPERLDRSRPIWVYTPGSHKTAWRGHRRRFWFGPQAQAIVERHLVRRCPACGLEGRAGRYLFDEALCGPCRDRLDEEGVQGPHPRLEAAVPGRYLFSPREATEERLALLRVARKTPVQPSQRDRSKANPKRQPGTHYLVTSYDRAVSKACTRAGVPPWHPHQLRHNAGTLLAQQFGFDVARIILGHRTLDATRIYSEDHEQKAIAAVAKFG